MPSLCQVARSGRGNLEGGIALMELFGCRLRGPPELLSLIPWRLHPREDPPPCIPEGVIPPVGLPLGTPLRTRSQGAAAGFESRGPEHESRSVSLPLFPSRAARRGQEGGQRAQDFGQQVQ